MKLTKKLRKALEADANKLFSQVTSHAKRNQLILDFAGKRVCDYISSIAEDTWVIDPPTRPLWQGEVTKAVRKLGITFETVIWIKQDPEAVDAWLRKSSQKKKKSSPKLQKSKKKEKKSSRKNKKTSSKKSSKKEKKKK